MDKLFGPLSMGVMEEPPHIGYFIIVVVVCTITLFYEHPLIIQYLQVKLFLQIKLEYPNEVLICISGYYGSVSRDERPKVIRSLTFYTSRGKYGPFGEEMGTFFTSTTTEGKVVGFHGRSSSYLDAIGVHMQHWLGNQRPAKSSIFKKFS